MDKRDIKILIIEDDIIISKTYQTKLGLLGYSAYTAYDGNEGLQKAEDIMPDMILLDLMLPKRSGFEVLETLKQNEKLKSIPVMVLTNLGQSDDTDRITKLGVVNFFIKSNVTLDFVISEIEKFLQKQGKDI